MRVRQIIVAGAVIVFAVTFAAWSLAKAARSLPQNDESVPAYHTQVPSSPLPATLDPSEFNEPVVKNAYHLASKVKRVLYQQPCYCHCDRSQGHGSLLDCFAGKHASVCGTCIQEGLYAYEQTKKGKTPVQIRAEIIHGQWMNVDLSKYQTYPPKD